MHIQEYKRSLLDKNGWSRKWCHVRNKLVWSYGQYSFTEEEVTEMTTSLLLDYQNHSNGLLSKEGLNKCIQEQERLKNINPTRLQKFKEGLKNIWGK